MVGQVLVASSGLTDAEYEELAQLTPAAHEQLGGELEARTSHLRDLLGKGDPFFILAVVQDMNLFVPWGEYYEPSHEGLETRIELVAGLLATQSVEPLRDRSTAQDMQAILDEIDHILLMNMLVNLTRRTTQGIDAASLRFTSANRWMGLRGSSFAGHAEELAVELYRGQETWMAGTLGYTVQDLIRAGRALSMSFPGSLTTAGAKTVEDRTVVPFRGPGWLSLQATWFVSPDWLGDVDTRRLFALCEYEADGRITRAGAEEKP